MFCTRYYKHMVFLCAVFRFERCTMGTHDLPLPYRALTIRLTHKLLATTEANEYKYTAI